LKKYKLSDRFCGWANYSPRPKIYSRSGSLKGGVPYLYRISIFWFIFWKTIFHILWEKHKICSLSPTKEFLINAKNVSRIVINAVFRSKNSKVLTKKSRNFWTKKVEIFGQKKSKFLDKKSRNFFVNFGFLSNFF